MLAPYPLARAYDYLLPEGMEADVGDYVRVPLGRRETVGVVWSKDVDSRLDPSKIKYILQKYQAPPMPEAHRQFLAWVARYTLSDLGSVLKMSLPVPEALHPSKGVSSYTLPETLPAKPSSHRKRVLDLLSDGKPRRAQDIAREAGCSPAIIRTMAAAGHLKSIEMSAPAYPCEMKETPPADLSFSDIQQGAIDGLVNIVRQKKHQTVLLDGVTGAGKTEVYFEAVAETLRAGRQALILLPEISLSAQFLTRFERRFGIAPALWHSEVSPARRRATWAGAAEGKTRVVVGARSALFLPYADLGLIVVDEEHDASYKQEDGVMYNARDMAIVRGHLGHIPVVLVSATPSVETMSNAKEEKYAYIALPARHAGAELPAMHVVDLKKNQPARGRFLSPALEEALHANFAAKEQSLLFLNRRGYAPLTLCRTCGHRFQCPSCSAWLVEHRRLQKLQCHHCGYAEAAPRLCPSCGSAEDLVACGPGVERIQEEIQNLLPDARTLVLASDVVTSPKVLSQSVQMIEKHEVDVIIGTQMIAKGHHFPSLTLVGVVDADLGLSGGDLRAGERTFQMLHQVAGRAGRGQKPGRVYLQTYMPDQMVIRALAAHDRDRFLEVETAERQKAGMPPFGRLAAVIVSGADETRLDQFCRALAQKAPRYDDLRVLGPAPAPMAFLRGKFRRRFLIKAPKGVSPQKYLQDWLSSVKIPSTLQLKIDIDPQSFY